MLSLPVVLTYVSVPMVSCLAAKSATRPATAALGKESGGTTGAAVKVFMPPTL